MSKYEVLLILDPKSDDKIVSEIAKSTFKSKDIKIEKLERTELAYEINKSKTAIYVLVNVEATGEEINEFTRKSNITKNIWRIMSVNLDSEKGLNRKAKPKKVRKPSFASNKVKKEGEASSSSIDKKLEETSETKVEKSTTKKSSKSEDKETVKAEEKPKRTRKPKTEDK